MPPFAPLHVWRRRWLIRLAFYTFVVLAAVPLARNGAPMNSKAVRALRINVSYKTLKKLTKSTFSCSVNFMSKRRS